VFVSLKMNDGSMYSSAEGEERFVIDDTIMIVRPVCTEQVDAPGDKK